MIKYFTQYVIVRYIISGGSAAVTQFTLFFIAFHVYGIHYLISSTIAFVGAFIVSFTLHRTWTFRNDITTEDIFIHKQAALYFITTLCALMVNNFLLYIFVHFLKVNVLVAQVIVMALVACGSFFVSRNFVFKYKKEHHIV